MAKKDKPDLPADKFLPVVIDSKASAQRVADAERVVIFSIDGVDYDMPKVQRADIALMFVKLGEENASDAAMYLLKETIGAEGAEALSNVVGLDTKEFDGVMTRVQAIALPKGRGAGSAARKP
jgi:hypothetical protein